MFITNSADAIKVIFGRCNDATFTLDRFNQHSDNIVTLPGHIFDGFKIVIGDTNESLHQRFKTCVHLAVAGSGECRHGAAMEAVFHYHNHRLFDAFVMAVQPRQFDGGLVGLGTGVGKENPLHAGKLG